VRTRVHAIFLRNIFFNVVDITNKNGLYGWLKMILQFDFLFSIQKQDHTVERIGSVKWDECHVAFIKIGSCDFSHFRLNTGRSVCVCAHFDSWRDGKI
jgi:hypothetical protein